MIGDRPFIKLFCYLNQHFLYDVKKNDIVELSYDEYEYLFRSINSGTFSYDSIKSSSYNRLSQLIDLGYMQNDYPDIIEHELTPYMQDYLTKRLQGITLQLTQNCNFRCRYCSFSGNGYFDRKHNGAMMSKDVAYKAIDFLKNNSSDLRKIRIGFYGGEPLLNYNLLKETVAYAKKVMPEKELMFCITTNLSILNDEIIRFLTENKFNIAVSLDGPQHYHDRYRRFAVDGSGTFSTVYNNLEKIFNYSSKFFSNYVTISSVVDCDDNVDELQEFFKQEFIRNARVNFSALDSSKTDFKKNPTEDFLNSYKENIFKSLMNNYIQTEGTHIKTNDVLFSNSGDFEELEKNLSMKTSIKQMHHSGPCIPGHSKMLVDVYGNLFTCEKASSNSSTMKIGNLYEGYDFDKARSLLNVGKLTQENCRKCWAIRFCSACAINIDNFDTLSKELKLKECEITVKKVEELLKDYVVVKKIKEVQYVY